MKLFVMNQCFKQTSLWLRALWLRPGVLRRVVSLHASKMASGVENQRVWNREMRAGNASRKGVQHGTPPLSRCARLPRSQGSARQPQAGKQAGYSCGARLQCSSRSVFTAASGSPCFTMLSPTRMAPQPAAPKEAGVGAA